MKHIKGILAATAACATFAAPAMAQQVGECGVYVFFNSGQATVGPRAAQVLNEYARSNPGATLQITGYSDAGGAAAANQALSQQRAQSVASQLAGANIVSVAGAGEATRPGTSGPNDPSNRRVEALRQNCTPDGMLADNAGVAAAAGLGVLALAAGLGGGGDDDDSSGTGTTTSSGTSSR